MSSLSFRSVIVLLALAYPCQASDTTIALTFPLKGLSPDTAPINSVFDHSMKQAYTPDGVVIAFTGEMASGKPIPLECYAGNTFIVNGRYVGAEGTNKLCYDGHPGYDFKAQASTVVAAADGIVTFARDIYADNSGLGCACLGNYIVITHANGFETLYGHLKQGSFMYKGTLVTGAELLGKQVSAGDEIAVTDNTGESYGEHLHFEVRKNGIPVDPYGWKGSGVDPYKQFKGIANVNLWISNTSGGNSGSTAIITGTVNGKTVDKAYVPITFQQRVAVLNVDTTSSTGAFVTSIAMPAGYRPNATAASQATNQVVVISYTSPDIQIIDASRDVLLSPPLTSPVTRLARFSGGSCMICGVLIDPSTNSAILDTAQGYLLLDLATTQFSSFIPGTVAGENFGYNSNTRIALNPTYLQGVPAGLQAIKLGDGSVSTYSTSVGSFPDATAIDINTNIAVVPDEFTGNQYLINMAGASFDFSTLPPSFSAPSTVFPINFTICGSELHDWSLVSVQSSSHLLFLGTEFADCAAVETLPTGTIIGAPPAPTTFHWGHMPPAPDGLGWNNGGDPHGIAVFTSVVDGKAYGFLVRSDQAWVARVDLLGVKNAPLKVGGGTNEVDLTPLVFFLKAQ